MGEYNKSESAELVDPDFPVSFDRDGAMSRLREAIRHAGTAEQIAFRSGVPKGTIDNLLRGTEVRWTAVFQIAIACHVSLDWLATGIGLQNWKQFVSDEKLSETNSKSRLTLPACQPERPGGLQESHAAMHIPERVTSDILAQAIEIVHAVVGGEQFAKAPPDDLSRRIVAAYDVLTGRKQ